jgi:hypothetical protein
MGSRKEQITVYLDRDKLDAQSALQQARDQHTDALTGYRLKLSRYKQATGQW